MSTEMAVCKSAAEKSVRFLEVSDRFLPNFLSTSETSIFFFLYQERKVFHLLRTTKYRTGLILEEVKKVGTGRLFAYTSAFRRPVKSNI